MEKKNSMANATIAVSMVMKLINARRNQNLKANVTNAKGMVTKHQNANPNHLIQLNNLLKLYLDGTTTPSVDVTILDNMDILA